MRKFQFAIYLIVEQRGADLMDARNRLDTKFFDGCKLENQLPETNSLSADKTTCEILGNPILLPSPKKQNKR